MKILEVNQGLYFKEIELVLPVRGEKIQDPHAEENLASIQTAIWSVYKNSRVMEYLKSCFEWINDDMEVMAWLILELAIYYRTEKISVDHWKSQGFAYLAMIKNLEDHPGPAIGFKEDPEDYDIDTNLKLVLHDSGIPRRHWELFGYVYDESTQRLRDLLGARLEISPVDPTIELYGEKHYPVLGIDMRMMVSGHQYRYGFRIQFSELNDHMSLDKLLKHVAFAYLNALSDRLDPIDLSDKFKDYYE